MQFGRVVPCDERVAGMYLLVKKSRKRLEAWARSLRINKTGRDDRKMRNPGRAVCFFFFGVYFFCYSFRHAQLNGRAKVLEALGKRKLSQPCKGAFCIVLAKLVGGATIAFSGC